MAGQALSWSEPRGGPSAWHPGPSAFRLAALCPRRLRIPCLCSSLCPPAPRAPCGHHGVGGEAVSLKLFIGQGPRGVPAPQGAAHRVGALGGSWSVSATSQVLGVVAPLGSLFSDGIGVPGLSAHIWPSASVDRGLCGPLPLWTVAPMDSGLRGPSHPWTAASMDCGLCGPLPLWTVASMDSGLCGPSHPWTAASVDCCLCGLSPPWTVASVDSGPRGLWPLWTVASVVCCLCGLKPQWTVASVDRGLHGQWPPWTVTSVDRRLCGLPPLWTATSVDCDLCGGRENVREEEAFEVGGGGQRPAALHALCWWPWRVARAGVGMVGL